MRRIVVLFAWLAGLLPLAATAQDGAYGIQPGDVLSIEVLEDPGLNRTVLVTPDGWINVPLAGAVRAQGRSLQEVEGDLAARLAPNFNTTPTVFVGIQSVYRAPPDVPVPPAPLPTINVFVIGEAGQTGRLQLDVGTTLLQAFTQMGGFTPFAATKRLQLRRTDPVTGQETIYRIDYNAIERGTSPNGRVTLQEGDVILVPQRRLFE